MGSRAMTNNTTPRMPHLKQILLWIAIWAAIFIVFRIIGWGVGRLLSPVSFPSFFLRTSFDGAFPLASYIHLWHISVHS